MNQKLFATWTKESAYLLGIIAVVGEADGATLSVNAPAADRSWLLQVAGILGLKKVSRGGTFVICNKKLMQPLWDAKAKHGLLVDAVPDDVFHHFARGSLDAGGSTSKVCVKFVGRPDSLLKIGERLTGLANVSDKSAIDSEPTLLPELKYTDKDVLKLKEFLYKDCEELYLPIRQQGFSEECTDVTREPHRPRNQRSGRIRESSKVLRPRTRQRTNYDSMVW